MPTLISRSEPTNGLIIASTVVLILSTGAIIDHTDRCAAWGRQRATHYYWAILLCHLVAGLRREGGAEPLQHGGQPLGGGVGGAGEVHRQPVPRHHQVKHGAPVHLHRVPEGPVGGGGPGGGGLAGDLGQQSLALPLAAILPAAERRQVAAVGVREGEAAAAVGAQSHESIAARRARPPAQGAPQESRPVPIGILPCCSWAGSRGTGGTLPRSCRSAQGGLLAGVGGAPLPLRPSRHRVACRQALCLLGHLLRRPHHRLEGLVRGWGDEAFGLQQQHHQIIHRCMPRPLCPQQLGNVAQAGTRLGRGGRLSGQDALQRLQCRRGPLLLLGGGVAIERRLGRGV
mmetsp:Transcript_15322/g.46290  ORF Transcript_15322/g.46290 Transcript_15322/m.46290 type:complete len:343 (+) Transcript_15322:878-1906(+)